MILCWASTWIPDSHTRNKSVPCVVEIDFSSKKICHQRYSRKKVVDIVSLSNDSLATSLQQRAGLWTTSGKSRETTTFNDSAFRLIFRLSLGPPSANYIKQLHLLPIQQLVLYKNSPFGSASGENSRSFWLISFSTR